MEVIVNVVLSFIPVNDINGIKKKKKKRNQGNN